MESPQLHFAVVLGDVVASRRSADRAALQQRLDTALRAVNGGVAARQPLVMTIGDEFQGIYDRLPDALHATLLLPLHLAEAADVRFGIGWGSLTLHDTWRAPYAQDGPAWWAARAALEGVTARARAKRSPRAARTGFAIDTGDETDRYVGALVNAYLLCRDQIVGRMDATDRRLLLGLLDGRTQSAIAAEEGITASAVSQRFARSGAYALAAAAQELESEVPSWSR